MKYIAWGLLTVVTGLIFGLALIFVVSFLQLNGVLLNDTIQFEATFKDFSWVEFVVAFGTAGAAFAAAFSAYAANITAKLSAATLNEMEAQRLSAERIAQGQQITQHQKQQSIAQADRALLAFALSSLCRYLTKVAQSYERLLREIRNHERDPAVSVQQLIGDLEFEVELPMREIEMLHKALSSNNNKLSEISSIFENIQVINARHIDYLDHSGRGLGGLSCLDEINYIARSYVDVTDLFDWSRMEDSEVVEVPNPVRNALANMRISRILIDEIAPNEAPPVPVAHQ
ncbi:hypothetical protein [Pseudovibrio sp. POLY-S9]|uniref:hypothetical protein n=1 Tax=Pseudovibrio sp. POLY-S9 TaxID=1576596 RepID=UPI000710ABF0|nr:hypothetical protein [Pseudovibrio sp. POLY-S9]